MQWLACHASELRGGVLLRNLGWQPAEHSHVHRTIQS